MEYITHGEKRQGEREKNPFAAEQASFPLSLCPKRDGGKREWCIPSLFLLFRNLTFCPGNDEAGPEIS
jgi:hypothetical protein